MFAQLKLYIIGAVVGAFGLLGLYAKYQSSRKEHYKKESEVQKDIADTIEKRVEAHEKREYIEQSNANKPVDVIDDGLQPYYRDKGS